MQQANEVVSPLPLPSLPGTSCAVSPKEIPSKRDIGSSTRACHVTQQKATIQHRYSHSPFFGGGLAQVAPEPASNPSDPDHDRLLTECANAARLLAVDSVNDIKAGHPGSAMGLAHLGASVLEFPEFNPANPGWADKRFVMSNGHACLLQYILLHLTGYDLQVSTLVSPARRTRFTW